jgi:cystathionine gamma-synthase
LIWRWKVNILIKIFLIMIENKGISTNCIHSGSAPDENGSIMPPIVLSTTFERQDDQLSFHNDYIYSRYDNPNRRSLEEKLAVLENGEKSIAFSSGLMAATAVFQSLRHGDHVLLPDDIYFGVRKIVMRLYEHWGLTYSMVDMTQLAEVEKAIRPNTKLIWMESPSNPAVKITDIASIVALAKSQDLFTVVDNTWATPFFTQPINLGVDIVLHSTTKYLGGHSDLLGGALVFKNADSRYDFIRDFQKIGGGVPSPFDCWLLGRSLATFAIRMPVHASNAMKLAQYLDEHDRVEEVFYPGLPKSTGYEVASKQMVGGYGGMMSILVKGGREASLSVCRRLNIVKHATSLGGVESLIEHRKSIEGEESLTPDNLLRISVGLENIEDLIADFKQALEL